MINTQLLEPAWNISINGIPLSESRRLLVSEISFEEKLTYTSKVEIAIGGGLGFDFSLDDIPLEGEMSLTMGWDNDEVELFNGQLVEPTPDFRSGRASVLTLTAYDRSYLLKKYRWPPEVYAKGNMLEIVRSILAKYKSPDFGLDYVIDPRSKIRDYALTDVESGFRFGEQTDWEFLSLIAKSNDLMLLVRGETVYVVNRDYFQQPTVSSAATTPSVELNFYYNPLREQEDDQRGALLYHFRPRYRALEQKEKVELAAWHSVDAKGKRRGGGSGLTEERGLMNYTKLRVNTKKSETLVIHGTAAMTNAAATILAQAEIEKRARKLIDGQGSIKGWPFVRLGQKHNFVINDLHKIGTAFSGEYFISGTEHTWSRESGYRTSIDVERKSLSE
ncbi:MAG: hypothetical protein WBP42_11525 [Candidatus Zixiibacteriota bacterium]